MKPASKPIWAPHDGKVFVIGPIGKEGSATRKRSNDIYAFVIKPAVKACKLAQPQRADMLAEPGSIPDSVIQHLIEDDLVIADLHDHNPNVFYELAVRHTTGKACLIIAEENDQLPFDVHAYRTIFLKKGSISSWDKAKNDLILQIRFIQNSASLPDTVVTTAFELLKLRRNQGLIDVFGMMERTRPARKLIRDVRAKRKTWRDMNESELDAVDDLCRSFDLLGVYDRLGIVNSMHVDLMYAVPFVDLYRTFLEDYIKHLRRPENRGKTHFWELVQFYERVKNVPGNHPGLNDALDWPENRRGSPAGR